MAAPHVKDRAWIEQSYQDLPLVRRVHPAAADRAPPSRGKRGTWLPEAKLSRPIGWSALPAAHCASFVRGAEMLVLSEKQASPSAVVGRYDMDLCSRVAGERERAIDAWTRPVLLTVCWLVRPTAR